MYSKEQKAKRAFRMREWRRLNRELSRRLNREYKLKTKDKVKIQNRKQYLKNKAVRIAYQEAYRRKKREKVRLSVWKSSVKRRYGLELELYDKLMQKPCGICKGKSQALDHDHKTGFIRAALCHTCNTSLGGFKDDVRLLINAIKYLCKHDDRHIRQFKRRAS